jgi:hypothetical protein
VLRCNIGDGGSDGEVTFHIDIEELSLKEFARLIRVNFLCRLSQANPE